MIKTQSPEPLKNDHTPKPLSVRQNLILTAKVLVGAAILLTLLWLSSELLAT